MWMGDWRALHKSSRDAFHTSFGDGPKAMNLSDARQVTRWTVGEAIMACSMHRWGWNANVRWSFHLGPDWLHRSLRRPSQALDLRFHLCFSLYLLQLRLLQYLPLRQPLLQIVDRVQLVNLPSSAPGSVCRSLRGAHLLRQISELLLRTFILPGNFECRQSFHRRNISVLMTVRFFLLLHRPLTPNQLLLVFRTSRLRCPRDVARDVSLSGLASSEHWRRRSRT